MIYSTKNELAHSLLGHTSVNSKVHFPRGPQTMATCVLAGLEGTASSLLSQLNRENTDLLLASSDGAFQLFLGIFDLLSAFVVYF